jgi:hypothetical protein
MIPERAINGRGLVIKKVTQDWVELTPTKKNKSVSMLNLKLSPDGTMKGELSKSYYDYAALDKRIAYKGFNSQDEYLKSIESKYIGLSVDNFTITGIDSVLQPLRENLTVTLKNRATKINNQMFISPLQFDKYTENPFKAEERVYPVDFLTAIENTQVFNLELPDGYSIEQLPKGLKMTLPEGTGSFIMQSSMATDNTVQVLFKLNLNKPIYYQQEYVSLKAFFDELVKKQAEMLIIKKG